MSGSMPKEARNEGLKELSRCNIERTARKKEGSNYGTLLSYLYISVKEKTLVLCYGLLQSLIRSRTSGRHFCLCKRNILFLMTLASASEKISWGLWIKAGLLKPTQRIVG